MNHLAKALIRKVAGPADYEDPFKITPKDYSYAANPDKMSLKDQMNVYQGMTPRKEFGSMFSSDPEEKKLRATGQSAMSGYFNRIANNPTLPEGMDPKAVANYKGLLQRFAKEAPARMKQNSAQYAADLRDANAANEAYAEEQRAAARAPYDPDTVNPALDELSPYKTGPVEAPAGSKRVPGMFDNVQDLPPAKKPVRGMFDIGTDVQTLPPAKKPVPGMFSKMTPEQRAAILKELNIGGGAIFPASKYYLEKARKTMPKVKNPYGKKIDEKKALEALQPGIIPGAATQSPSFWKKRLEAIKKKNTSNQQQEKLP
jgi:hypothetical protein